MKRLFLLSFCLLLVCCHGVAYLNAQTSPVAPKASLLLHMDESYQLLCTRYVFEMPME